VAASLVVTGASGFVGRHLVQVLQRHGRNVICRSARDGDIAGGLTAHEPVSHVIHLAGRTFVPDSWVSPPEFYETNLLGTAQVAEFCRRGGARLMLVSSYVYGRPQRLPIAEDHPVDPFNPYAHSKILAEQVALYYERAFGVPVTIIRPFNLYGPGQDRRFLIPTLLDQVRGGGPQIEVADLRPRRDFLYIDDFVDLLLAALDGDGGIYNAGSGHSVGVQELIDVMLAAAGVRKTVVSRDERRPDEVLDVVADISKAERDLGWRPRTTIETGIAHLLSQPSSP
jgi:nucleoside-diphosphate-sugar epimerase